MNPEIIHQTAEQKAKCWLREKYTMHGTVHEGFKEFTGTEYETEVKDLAENIYTYIEDPEKKRTYLSTINLDW